MSSYEEFPVGRPPAASPPRAGCLGLLLLAIAVVGAVFLWWSWPRRSGLNPNAEPRPVTARGELSELEKMNIRIYQEASPSLVQVTNLAERDGLFGLDIQEVPKGVGSGFVWDTDGHVVTNYHVVKGANAAQVTLSDQKTYDARQIWYAPDQDIAVLWIDVPRKKLHPILVGTSHDLKVGQITFALGDPFGLDQTMTTGIVSALGRRIEASGGHPISGAIQTNAAINPGNSGGPLLDSAGRLIGMNTAILSPSGAFAGIGFAIPVDEINQVVPQLIRHGKVVHPRLGVTIAPDQLAQQLGVDKGALILKVTPDSPAAQAGLLGTEREQSGHIRLGDAVVAVDGKEIDNGKELSDEIQQHKVGDTVTVAILRDGKRQDVQVTLQGG
jgi:S1-C subfamily serine protease